MTLVPMLTIIFTAQNFPAPHVVHMAVATSTATMVFTAMSSVRAHHGRGAVLWPVVAAMAPGIVVGSLNGITPSLGAVALNVLAVVMLAGISSVGGVIIAGIFIGWVETMVGAYLGAAWQNFMPYLVVLLVMTVKPNGLFGEQHIERI